MAVLFGVALTLGSTLLVAPAAQAATARNGVCEDGEFCLYYKLRSKLDVGLGTRYALVLRTIEYTPPQRIDEPTRQEFHSRIVVDAFIVDLRQPALLCSFTADAKYSDLAVMYNSRTSWAAEMYEDMSESLGYQIVRQLETLTGGTAGKPK